ncbi:uncharacterized protein B0T15DRAFT_312133 [Chaetomium strumarium]|uniref:Uncharacterized protein n=1 Tax=Chaetomium strumarium TaxID=1170767 RepID=A0AAJ0GMH1_9PEZI|nr:hypothetical protein B0T15DRAFT_312133 [Chaetomium strumarium]
MSVCIECHTPKVIFAHDLCTSCYSRKNRANRRESGRCTQCGGVRDDDLFLLCSACRERKGKKKQERQSLWQRRRMGLCVECHAWAEMHNQTKCRGCYRKQLREEHKVLGVCTDCGGPRDEECFFKCLTCRKPYLKSQVEQDHSFSVASHEYAEEAPGTLSGNGDYLHGANNDGMHIVTGGI